MPSPRRSGSGVPTATSARRRVGVPTGRVPGGGVDPGAPFWAVPMLRPPTTSPEEETRVLVTLVTVGFPA